MDELLARLEAAVRSSDDVAALRLLDSLRREGAALTALWATVECLLVELDASQDANRYQRFAERVRAGFDHDIDK
jgi:hypothetical protein